MSYTFHYHLINCKLTFEASDCSAEDEVVLTYLPNAHSSYVSGKRACRSKHTQKKMQAQSLPETQKQADADAITIKLCEELVARPNLSRLSSRKQTMRGQNQANREVSHTAAYRPNRKHFSVYDCTPCTAAIRICIPVAR